MKNYLPLLFVVFGTTRAIPFNKIQISPRSGQPDLTCNGTFWTSDMANFYGLDVYHWMQQYDTFLSNGVTIGTTILHEFHGDSTNSIACTSLKSPCEASADCISILKYVTDNQLPLSRQDVARANLVLIGLTNFQTCMENIYETIGNEGLIDGIMADELIQDFLKDPQVPEKTDTKGILSILGTIVGAGMTMVPGLEGTGVPELAGGLFEGFGEVMQGGSDKGYVAIQEYLQESIQVKGIIVSMLKNAQIGLQTTATKVMNGDRDWGNWALWDWLQAGKFVELGNEACSSPEFQGWIANAMKATVINAVWKTGGAYIVRVPVDDCAGNHHQASNYWCDPADNNKWQNTLRWYNEELIEPGNLYNYHAVDPKGASSLGNPNQFYGAGLNVNEGIASSVNFWRWNGLNSPSDDSSKTNTAAQWAKLLTGQKFAVLQSAGTSIGGIWNIPVCQVPSSDPEINHNNGIDNLPFLLSDDGKAVVPCHCQFADGSDSTEAFRARLQQNTGNDFQPGKLYDDCAARGSS